MSDGFVVHLGGGLYLDSGGGLTTGPQTPVTQVYKGAGGLKLDTDKISNTLKEIADFLEDEKTQEKIRKLGLSDKTLSVVLQAAQIGAVAATAASVAFLALGAALALIGELTKDDGMSPELASLLQSIKDDLKAIDDRLISDAVLSVRSRFHTAATNIRTTMQDIVVQKLTGAARIAKFAEMQAEVRGLGPALSDLQAQDWSPLYRTDDYKELFSLSHMMQTRKPDGSYAWYVPAPTVRRFDYRLGVPILAYVATAYPVLASAGLPWFRSAGSHALRMRELANTIDAFVTRMYSESLARTFHTAQSLFQCEGRVPTFAPHFLPGADLLSARRTTWRDEFLVGAVDLVRYTDEWFGSEFGRQLGELGYDSGRRGAFDYSWPRDGRTQVVLDPATVKEANDQAAQDFADLQVASGMVHLMAAAARLRFFSTPPVASETVTGATSGGRSFVDEQPATARSPWIFPTGQIERPATLQRFQARARARITTQAPGYPFSFNYRVRLVSVDSRRGDDWSDAGYIGNIWQASYVPASDPRDQRLDVQIDRQRLLAEHLLYEGPTPPGVVNRQGRLDIRASTFDWYMPDKGVLVPVEKVTTTAGIKALATKTGGSSGRKSALGRPGSTSIHLLKPGMTMETTDGGSPGAAIWLDQPVAAAGLLENITDAIAAMEPADRLAEEGAERRWVKEETVTIEWSLTWQDGRLSVVVSGQPHHRPFQVWVIVEEDVYSGESVPANIHDILAEERLRTQLHSAFALEVVNQLMVVPRDFFKAERDAMTFGETLWHDLNERFAKSRDVGRQPPSPVDFQRRLNTVLGDSVSTAGLVERQNRRFAFIQEHAPEALESVLQDRGVGRVDMRGLDAFR